MKKQAAYIAATLVALAVIYLALFSKPSYEPGEMQEHIRGNHNAPVVIVEFSDFQCPYCGAVQPTLKQLMQEYPDDVKLIYRHFPLPSHAYAMKAAEASECASDQGKFWEYHDMLFGNQNRLDLSSLKEYAAQIGLNSTSFNSCLDSGVMSQRVKFAQESGIERGVSGTPTFLINDRMLSGNQPYNVFKSAVDGELEKVK
ncbi:MAG: DsbA family protein [Candidatus Aenigmarchaeota archaeon]|nr:DsbA family protein [Candidatus Aenigmarchaeota archaeon]